MIAAVAPVQDGMPPELGLPLAALGCLVLLVMHVVEKARK